ncbi:MAG: DUF3106 domain-containing protein [Burkholderiales bacterium]|nr:DUF3106 domain-containing protein [Burkholderiales bacterium]
MAKALFGLALGLSLYVPALVLPGLPLFAFVPAAHAASSKSGPAWDQLTSQQRQILAPIQSEWASLDAAHKRKWLGIAKRYPAMTEKEQARLQERMREWVNLTPDERRAARAQYREFEQMSPKERRAVRKQWDAYQRERQDEARKAEEARQAAAAAQPAPEPLGAPPTAAGLRAQ